MEKSFEEDIVAIAPSIPVTIEVNYNWICEQLLLRCKRTPDGHITPSALIDAFMEFTREQK